MFNPIDERKSLSFRRQNVLSDQLIKRLESYGTLGGHEGCVNAIEWNYSGTQLCSVSDDCNIILWDPFKKKKLTQFHSHHNGNIFSVKFLGSNRDNLLVTAAGDYKCIVHDIVTHEQLMICKCHNQRVKKLATQSQDLSVYWSAGEDGLVIQADIREKHQCRQDTSKNVFIDLKEHCGSSIKISSIACNPVRNELIAVGTNDQYVRLYDRRMIRTMEIGNTIDNLPENCVKYYSIGIPSDKLKPYHMLACTHLAFSQTGAELLANISSDNIYLFNTLHSEKPKIFSTDLINLFGHLEEDWIDIEDSSFDTKRLKMSSSNVSPSSNSSSNSSYVKVSKSSNLATTANDSSSLTSIDSVQVPSTSKAIDNEETDETLAASLALIEHKSKKIIKKINKKQKPNLIKLKAKHKIPKHIAPIYKTAQSYLKKEKYSDAIELMNETISLTPNISRFYTLRANAYRGRKWNRDLYCAVKDLYKSLEIDSNNKESHLKLVHCLYELNHYEIAYQCLNHFREKQSKDTRYKEFKELEKKVLAALRRERNKKIKSDCRKFVGNINKTYLPRLPSQNTGNNINQPDQSSSSSSISSMSTLNSIDLIDVPTLDDTVNESSNNSNSRHSIWQVLDNDSDSHQMSHDSDVHNVKRTKSAKELQWRSDSHDFEQRFLGHCNESTDIMEANFFGCDGQYIVAGSDDDGNFYVWNRKTTNIVNIIKADDCIVNCVQPHYNSCFLATSGIDNSIKLWSPTMSEETLLEKEKVRKSMIRERIEENQNKRLNSNSFGVMFLRVTQYDNDSSDSDEDENSRQTALSIRGCLPS